VAKVSWTPRLDIEVIKHCVEYLLNHTDTIGLFRIPGSASSVDRIFASFEFPNTICLEGEDNPHNVAGTLKLYFRSLSNPVFPYSLFDTAMDKSTEYTDTQNNIEVLKEFLTLLPQDSYQSLKMLMRFLKILSFQSEINKMDAENLGIVFGPTLIRQSPEQETPTSALIYAKRSSNLVVGLIEKYEQIFDDVIEHKPSTEAQPGT